MSKTYRISKSNDIDKAKLLALLKQKFLFPCKLRCCLISDVPIPSGWQSYRTSLSSCEFHINHHGPKISNHFVFLAVAAAV